MSIDEIRDGDERLRELADDYHRPPPTPREAMWAAVQARLAEDVVPPAESEVVAIAARPRHRWSAPWLATAAAAAMIALGFALGRFTGPRLGSPAAEPVAAADPAAGDEAFRTALATHLARSEELLTLVRSDARTGRVDRAVGEWGGALLVETRLLLDSPVGSDPELRPVLEDLELLLAQVALLREEAGMEERGREELKLIAEGMDTQDMLTRIQAVLPVRAGI